VPGSKQVNQPVLHLVGVLELVDQDIVKALTVFFQDLRMVLEQPHGLHQQVAEIKRVGLLQALLVEGVDTGHLFGLVIIVLELLRPDPLVLRSVDRRGHRPGLELLFVDAKFLQDDLEQTLLVLVIVDGEVAVKAEGLDLLAQNPDTGRMEGADPEALAVAEQLFETRLHLAGRLVGERHSQDLPRIDLVLPDQPGDPVG